MSTPIPRQFGQYQVVRQIGRGGVAQVFLAQHPRFGRVALKLLLPSVGRFPEAERRFHAEARLLQQMRHPNVLRLYETGSVNLPGGHCQHYLATEYMPDGSLYELLLRSGGRLAEPVALSFAVQIADALAYAHARGVIHRDLKPSNILLNGNQAILSDFGIARALTEATITQGLRIMGTLAYMSPEQTLGNRNFVRRGSDIYSFGVVLYEMLSGHQPRANPDLAELAVVHQIQHVPLPPLRQVAPHTSSEIAIVVHRCLQQRRENRYDTMNEVANSLRQVATRRNYNVPSQPHISDVPHLPTTPWPLIASVSGAALLLVVLLIVLLGTTGS